MAEFLFSLTKNDILFKIQYIIFNNEADFNSEPNKPNKINEPNELTKRRTPMELEIKNVSHTYKNGKKALSEISTSLTPGVYGLLGPNGAGKSTLMNIITDNLRPTAGEVSLDGNVIWKNSNAYRARLGYMPQQQGLYSSFTGTRFLWYMAALKGLSHREAKTRVNELLELVNLKDAADRRIGGYSGGMKQRFLIAQALLNEPDVLVLDEPTAGSGPERAHSHPQFYQ